MPKRAAYQQYGRRVRVYFKEWREHAGLTQQKLADRLGTSKTRVSMKERGIEGWDDAYLAALAEALGLDEPASLLVRNPLDRSAPWSLLDNLKPASRAKVLDYIDTLRRAEQTEDKAA